MNPDLLKESEQVFGEYDRLRKFSSKFKTYPAQKAANIVYSMQNLAEQIAETEVPQNHDELLESELKRRLHGEALSLEQILSGRNLSFAEVIAKNGIPPSDIINLQDWLGANKKSAEQAIERLFEGTELADRDLDIRLDIPSVKRQVEEFAAVHIERYHSTIGRLVEDISNVGGFLRDIRAVPTTQPRSYFNLYTNTLAIGIPAIAYTNSGGDLQIRERDLIALYGHEGMGHALNTVMTRSNGVPHFLQRESEIALSTMESVAQFYEKIIFEDLKQSTETQKRLGIQHHFDDIYQESRDMQFINDYQRSLQHYAIAILANPSLGEPHDPETIKKKVAIIRNVSLDPGFAQPFVESHRYHFDLEGNLHPDLVRELIYCAKPVQRALDEFAKEGIKYEGDARSNIDATLLKGFWTPIGYVDNARLKAQGK